MLTYDTDFIIRRVLTDDNAFDIFNEKLTSSKDDFVLLRSVVEELLTKFRNISLELIRFLDIIKKRGFAVLMNDARFQEFIKRNKEIGGYINENCSINEQVVNILIERIQLIYFQLGFSYNVFPTKEEQYDELKKGSKYKELLKKCGNCDDCNNLVLAEILGQQQCQTVQFVSCDRGDIIGEGAKAKIKKNFKFIEPIDGFEYSMA